MYLVKLKPVCDKTIWVSDHLTITHGMGERGLGTRQEIGTHSHAKNVILNGEHVGKTLDELIQVGPQSILGEKQLHQMLRPAYLDAREDLSIQIHPYDECAGTHENDEGKTESWYILEADKGAALVAGMTASDVAVIRAVFENDQVEDHTRKAEMEAGDFVYIDAGMLHALGKGILILGIGQNSNTTYQFYDYHRQNVSGRERELHIDKGFNVTSPGLHCNKVASPFTDADITQEELLVNRREFSMRLVDVVGSYVLPQSEKRFYCPSNVSAGRVLRCQGEELPFALTENIFIPAGCVDTEICGKVRTLISSIGQAFHTVFT